jgi:hypothetical protein
MASSDEGLLTFSIGMRVSPEPGAIELLKRYNTALNYAINKILRLNLKKIWEVHNALYRELREWFDLPSRVAMTAIEMPLQNANAWRNNPRKGGDLGLGSHQCSYTKDQGTGLKMAT